MILKTLSSFVPSFVFSWWTGCCGLGCWVEMNEGRTQFQVDPGTGYRKTLGTFKNKFEIIGEIVNLLFSNTYILRAKEAF